MTLPSLELGAIGNCAASALVDPRGRIVWSCWPRFDGDPLFHALLGGGDAAAGDGSFGVELVDCVRTEQHYEANTAVLRTRLFDSHGQSLEITDFAPRFFSRGRMFRPLMLVRRLRVLQGAPRVRIVLRPRFDWGAAGPRITQGSHHIRYIGPDQVLRLTTTAPLTYVLQEEAFVLSQTTSLLLGPDETLSEGIEELAGTWERETIAYWRQWTRRLALPLQWQDAVIRAAITLKLCVFEDTGAIVAALTTSIPEAPGSQRNWDYRYCWLRDAFFVVRALNSLSEVGTMEDYLRWLTNVVAQRRAAAMCSRCTASAWSACCPSRWCRSCPATAAWAGAARQPGARTLPARRLRQHRARRCAGLPRPAPAAPRPAAPSSRLLEAVGEQACARARPARCRHVGAAHARARAHLVAADVLGRLRPAGQDRRPPAPARPRRPLAGARRRACASACWPRPGTPSARLSPRAWAASTSTPACC